MTRRGVRWFLVDNKSFSSAIRSYLGWSESLLRITPSLDDGIIDSHCSIADTKESSIRVDLPKGIEFVAVEVVHDVLQFIDTVFNVIIDRFHRLDCSLEFVPEVLFSRIDHFSDLVE